MTKAILSAPRFTDDDAAREYLESIRWPQGAICPHCGGTERNSPIAASQEAKVRPGLYFCGDCRTQFTVTVGTVFERSKIALHKWVLATHLMCASKKGISSKQIERMLGVTYKTAWFMTHRIREAMKDETGGLLGGGGKIVEADETYFGTEEGKSRKGMKAGANLMAMNKIVSLVQRKGKVRSMHVADVTSENLKKVLLENVHTDTHLMTDSSPRYNLLKREKPFAKYDQLNNSKGEYARGISTTNTVEGYFSILKRGLVGTFHHVSSAHLKRYVAEFDFRYNNRSANGIEDVERTQNALKGISGKRLTYRRIGETKTKIEGADVH